MAGFPTPSDSPITISFTKAYAEDMSTSFEAWDLLYLYQHVHLGIYTRFEQPHVRPLLTSQMPHPLARRQQVLQHVL